MCSCWLHLQAEIEHFVNPEDKRHPKFANIAELQPLLYSRAMQMGQLFGCLLVALLGC